MDAKDRIIAKLQARVVELEALFKAAMEKIAALEKNSQTSHKPPSTDIVKPVKTKSKKKRKQGAQPGHKQNLRKPFPPEQVEAFVCLTPEIKVCPQCHDRLVASAEPPLVTQQIEIPTQIIHVTEYRQHACDCKKCNVSYYAPLPDEVAAGGLLCWK